MPPGDSVHGAMRGCRLTHIAKLRASHIKALCEAQRNPQIARQLQRSLARWRAGARVRWRVS
jgi:hypothetical protein